jgi:hypothetical protein
MSSSISFATSLKESEKVCITRCRIAQALGIIAAIMLIIKRLDGATSLDHIHSSARLF